MTFAAFLKDKVLFLLLQIILMALLFFFLSVTGYPKAKGIEIAVKYLNPEYIVCDEIGTSDEAEAICRTQHSGVPLIATVHAATFEDVCRRKNISSLLENNVFDYGMKIKKEGKNFRYEIKKLSNM